MSASITELMAAGHSNIVVRSQPGMGTVHKITSDVRESGRKVTEVPVSHLDVDDFALAIPDGSYAIGSWLLNSDVLILTEADSIRDDVMNFVEALVLDRSVAGIKLDNVIEAVILVTSRPTDRINALIAETDKVHTVQF